MARYGDLDALLENLKKQYGEELGWQCTVNMSDVGMMIEDAPTADVVPRSEVEEIFEEIDKKIKASITMHLEELNKEYVQDTPLYDRHSGILFALQHMDDLIAELKKKYTEGKK